MNEQLIFFSLSKDELQNIITNAVKQALETKQEKELMTFKETCELLNISASCLNQWKSQGRIPFKKLGKRIFFSRAEIANVLEEAGNYKKLRELR
jgi:excisionase family DNA binding protein